MHLGHGHTKTVPLAAFFGLLFFVAACGLKVWPQPQADEDTFAWEDVSFVSSGTCLEINGTLSGAYENLAKIELEIAYADADCIACPFQAEQRIVLRMDAPELSRSAGSVRIRYCQLSAPAPYRWRVVAYNVHSLLEKVQSKVFIATE